MIIIIHAVDYRRRYNFKERLDTFKISYTYLFSTHHHNSTRT